MRRHRAFTLVELLIVIGIIAVLVALLLPALSAIRKSSRDVACRGNLRSLGVGFMLYHTEFGNWNLPHKDGDGVEWHANKSFRTFMGLDPKLAADTSQNSVWPRTLLCPDAVGLRNSGAKSSTVPKYPGKNSVAGAYGYNHEHTRRPEYEPYRISRFMLNRVNRRQEKILLSDAPTWETDWVGINQYVHDDVYASEYGIYGAVAYRHGTQAPARLQRLNVLFYDGHVEQMSRPQITAGAALNKHWKFWTK